MFTKRFIVPTTIFVLGLACLPIVASEQEHHETQNTQSQHDEGESAEHKTDTNDFSAAVASIEEHLIHVAQLIEDEQLAEIHAAAKPIEMIAKTLAKLAYQEDSGVPRDQVREINLTAKPLAALWASIDEAGDSGDLEGTKEVYQEMVDLNNTLWMYVRIDTYATALTVLDKHLIHVGQLIEDEQLAEVHAAAKPIETIAKTLAKLAYHEDSGVPSDEVREINLTAKPLAALWAKIDEAGDSGDLEGTKEVYQEMVDLLNTLKKYAESAQEEHHEQKQEDKNNDGQKSHHDH